MHAQLLIVCLQNNVCFNLFLNHPQIRRVEFRQMSNHITFSKAIWIHVQVQTDCGKVGQSHIVIILRLKLLIIIDSQSLRAYLIKVEDLILSNYFRKASYIQLDLISSNVQFDLSSNNVYSILRPLHTMYCLAYQCYCFINVLNPISSVVKKAKQQLLDAELNSCIPFRDGFMYFSKYTHIYHKYRASLACFTIEI